MTDVYVPFGGAPNPSATLVSADQRTILGDGTREDPLRLGATPQIVRAQFAPPLPASPSLGESVAITDAGILPDPVAVRPAGSAPGGLPNVFGLVVEIQVGDVPIVTVQTAGIVQLPVQTWNQVTGGTSGLAPGAIYYLSDLQQGGLIDHLPTTPHAFIEQVGVALSPTELLLSLANFPRST